MSNRKSQCRVTDKNTNCNCENPRNIMFFQWRFHTNMHPVVKGLKDNGHKIRFLTQYRSTIENHSVVRPRIISYSIIFRIILQLLNIIVKFVKFDVDIKNVTKIFGLPSIRYVYSELNEFEPDMIIIRNYYPSTLYFAIICTIFDKNVVFMDLTPQHSTDEDLHILKRMAKSTVRLIMNIATSYGFIRITPLKGNNSDFSRLDESYYVPFVMENDTINFERDPTHFTVLCIGKFNSRRKNHLDLLKAVDLLDRDDIQIKLIGQLENKSDAVYNDIISHINSNSLQDIVEIKTNVEHESMSSEYNESDIFVFPARDEPLGISLLEAMGHGLPVICTDTIASKEYMIDGENGYIYETNDVIELSKCIQKITENQKMRESMAKNSFELVEKNHSPTQYSKALSDIYDKKFS